MEKVPNLIFNLGTFLYLGTFFCYVKRYDFMYFMHFCGIMYPRKGEKKIRKYVKNDVFCVYLHKITQYLHKITNITKSI